MNRRFGKEFNSSKSELFRAIPKSLSEPIRKKFRFSFVANRSNINSSSIRNFNPIEYESFRSRISIINLEWIIVLDRNLILVNQNYSGPFQNFFPNDSEPIRKKFQFSFVENRSNINSTPSDPLQFNSRLQSDSIRIIPISD